MGRHLIAVHVLVVDDSPEMLDLLTEMLEQQGATVTAVATAEQALDLVEKLRPDVLISDLEMPEKSGLWLIGQVRALEDDRGGRTPAACLTGSTEPELRARILRAGFQYHVAKPFEIRRVVGIVAILALKT